MSHRDKDCRSQTCTNAQELTTIVKELTSEVDWKCIRLREECRWTPLALVVAALTWAWSSKDALKDRFQQALRVAQASGRRSAPTKTSYQAYMKMLVRWTEPLSGCLKLALQLDMERKFPDEFRTAGFVVFAADGSKVQLPRTRSNEARYSPTTRGQKGKRRRKADRGKRRPRSIKARRQRAKDMKADCPQMAMTLLLHVALRLPWEWRLGPSNVSEREHLRDMIRGLPADALVTADCGFVGYDFWSELLDSGRHFVIRVGGNVRLLKKLGVVREFDGIVYLWPDGAANKGRPPLVLRLVVVHDGRRPWHLVTSVCDRRRLSDRQVAEIYKRRWRIELFFRHFKQTYGRSKLRSHKAEHAQCEAEWSLLGLWAMLQHARSQLPPDERGRLSVAHVLRAFGQAIDEHKCRPEEGESLNEQLAIAVVDRYRRKNRCSRGYPRKKYEPPTKNPRLRKATAAQRELAKQLMLETNRKRLTA